MHDLGVLLALEYTEGVAAYFPLFLLSEESIDFLAEGLLLSVFAAILLLEHLVVVPQQTDLPLQLLDLALLGFLPEL